MVYLVVSILGSLNIEGVMPSEPTRSPNVVIVVLDDAGYSDIGCFGSEISTPNIDRLAAEGLRFANFHASPLCSPTRASLLTGRNAHTVGMGFLTDVDTGLSHSRGIPNPQAAMLSEILGEEGYATFAVGKWHLAPLGQASQAGPFHAWPLGRGFDRFYGFLGGLTDQYDPELVSDNTHVNVPREPGYHLSRDLADRAVSFIRDHVAVSPERPFFLYFCLGAVHAPHQVDRAYSDQYVSVFEKGWDRTRQDRLSRQIDFGLLPHGTQLTERPPEVRAWADLSAVEQRHAVQLQAAYAGFLQHADEQIGRVIGFLEDISALEDTIVVLLSDNGAAGEGGQYGSINVNRAYRGQPTDPAEELEELRSLEEGPSGHYPTGWAMAGNTPFRRYKFFVDAGGVNVPLIIRCPELISDPGSIRQQFGHVIDVVPTVLDLVNVPARPELRGTPQIPIHGASLKQVLEDPDARSPRESQFYELFGHRAIWHEDWRAVGFHRAGDDYASDSWQLFNLKEDASEAIDLALERPDRLRQLQDKWWEEAGRYGALPLDERSFAERFDMLTPEWPAQRTRFVYYQGQSVIPRWCYPSPVDADFSIDAEIDGTIADLNGALVSVGNARGGYILWLRSGRPAFEYSHFGDRRRMEAEHPLPNAPTIVTFRFASTGGGLGVGHLLVDGISVATLQFDVPFRENTTEGMRIGEAARPYVAKRVATDESLDLPPGALTRVVFRISPKAQPSLPADTPILPPQ